jgi:hypothetical protein
MTDRPTVAAGSVGSRDTVAGPDRCCPHANPGPAGGRPGRSGRTRRPSRRHEGASARAAVGLVAPLPPSRPTPSRFGWWPGWTWRRWPPSWQAAWHRPRPHSSRAAPAGRGTRCSHPRPGKIGSTIDAYSTVASKTRISSDLMVRLQAAHFYLLRCRQADPDTPEQEQITPSDRVTGYSQQEQQSN